MEEIVKIQAETERARRIAEIQEKVLKYYLKVRDGEISNDEYEKIVVKINLLRDEIKEKRDIYCKNLYFWHILVRSNLDQVTSKTIKLDTGEGDIENFINTVLVDNRESFAISE